MRLRYKLVDGNYALLDDFGWILIANKCNNKYLKEYRIKVDIVDAYNQYVGDSLFTKFYKSDGDCYFVVNNQKISVFDYEYLKIDELLKKLNDDVNVSLNEFVISIMENADSLAFIERRRVPDLLFPFEGVRSYHGEYSFENIICVPMEENYNRKQWNYKIETIPFDENEAIIYGNEKYYIEDYYSAVCRGDIKLILKKDIYKYNYFNEKTLIKKRKKKD